jgi:hypothetical protein
MTIKIGNSEFRDMAESKSEAGPAAVCGSTL